MPSKRKRLDTPYPLEAVLASLNVPIITLELGSDLFRLAEMIRKSYAEHTCLEIATTLGFLAPEIEILLNSTLAPNEYILKLRTLQVSHGKPPANKNGDVTTKRLLSILSHEIKYRAHELLSRQMLSIMVDRVKQHNPVLIEELIPRQLPLGTLRNILQRLLRERVSIRDLVTIFENLADIIPDDGSLNAGEITERLRQSISNQICSPLLGSDDTISIITLNPNIEHVIEGSIEKRLAENILALNPVIGHQILKSLHDVVQKLTKKYKNLVLLCKPIIRPHVRDLIALNFPDLTVLSYGEIAPGYRVSSVGTVAIEGVFFVRKDTDGIFRG